jgi:hypothetical protein
MAKRGPDQDWRQHVIDNVLPRMEATTEQATGFTPAPANPQPFSAGVQLQPQFDVIELLPPAAQELLRLLRQRAADAHALIPTGFDVQTASAERVAAANALRRLTDHPQDGGFGLKDDGGDRRVIDAQRTLAKATDDFERIKQRSDDRAAAWHAASGALAIAEPWLKSGRPGGTTLAECDWPEPKLLKGETALDAIERLRRRCRELKADLHRIASAPFPSAYCKQQMRGQIEALAMQGAPSASLLIEHDGKIEFQTQSVRSEMYGEQRQAAFAEISDTVALVAWLHKDALIAALDREIASEADDKAALTHEARQKAEAETMADLLAVERDESWFVWQAQSQGLPIEHRADISPLALLGVRLVTTPRADGLLPSSPERAGFNIIGGRR